MLHLTVKVSNCLKGLNPKPLSGSPPTHARRSSKATRHGRTLKILIKRHIMNLWNLKMRFLNKNAPNPLWYGNTPLSLLHELNYPPRLYSWVAPGALTLITRVVHKRKKKPQCLFICLPVIIFSAFLSPPPHTHTLQTVTSWSNAPDRVLNGFDEGLGFLVKLTAKRN